MRPAGTEVVIRNIEEADAEAVAGIYNHYITETVITFEEEKVSSSEIDRRVQAVRSNFLPWLVAERSGDIVGYAYAGSWHGRSAYRFSTEVTVYIRPGLEGNGIGSRLYDQLLPLLRSRGMHTAVGVIALPNESSIALHEKFGFVKAAHFKEVGFKFNRWIDVGYWQCIL